MLKRLLKIAGWLLAFLLVVGIGYAIAFTHWLTAHERALETGSQIAATARGPIEYAIAGQGVPILRIHGSPGGYDHSIIGAQARPQDIAGFQVIAVSRPGYLRTPLSSGATPAEQADLYAALLDEMGIERVFVHGISGGGPSALHFAAKYPQRTIGLVLVVPFLQSTQAYRGPMPAAGTGIMAMQDFAWWFGSTLNEPMAKVLMPKMMHGFDAGDPLQMALIDEVGRGFIPARLRRIGRLNDIEQYRALHIESLALERLDVPTLILHGTADANAPFAGSLEVAKRMPRAELVPFEGEDHYMIITRAREITERWRRFMQAQLVREATAATPQ